MNETEHKALFRKTFDTVSEGYDNPAARFFVDSIPHLVEGLNLAGEEAILDVATGTGNAAFEVARQVPRGRVHGIDFSKGMLRVAERKKAVLGQANVHFSEMDMQAIAFPEDTFDVAFCCFSIFFVADMAGLLGHMTDKVKPGGKVATTTFYRDLFLPLSELFLNRIERYGVAVPPLNYQRTDTQSKCRALFQAAGLKEIVTFKKNVGYYLTRPEQWWDIVWNAGYRGLVDQLSGDAMAAFKTEHLSEVAALSTDDGIWLNVRVVYTIGRRASV